MSFFGRLGCILGSHKWTEWEYQNPNGCEQSRYCLTRIIHEKCTIKANLLLSLTTMRMGCLMKFFAMKSLAQVFGGLGRFWAV